MVDHTQACCPAQTLFPRERGRLARIPLWAGKGNYETRGWREWGEGSEPEQTALGTAEDSQVEDTACNLRQGMYGMGYV